MSLLDTSNFTQDEVRKRMVERAATIWQMRVRDVDTADPLVGYLMDACAFEFENTAKVIESTRQRIIDRLASVMCPEVIDLPRPAHAILSCRPENPIVDLAQTVQFFYRQLHRNSSEKSDDLLFSPLIKTRLINADVKYIFTERELFQLRGRDRLVIQQRPDYIPVTSYESVWLGLQIDDKLPSVSDLTFYFDWENETEASKAGYCRKIQDWAQTSWWLNDQQLTVKTGLHSPSETDETYDGQARSYENLSQELDSLKHLELQVKNYYNQAFVTVDQVPDRLEMDYTLKAYPDGFSMPDSLISRYLNEKLLWIEIRLRRDFPKDALSKMDVRVNCLPVINRRLNENHQRLQQSVNVYPLVSPEEFLSMKRVYYADGNELYRSSPLRNADEMAENSFMYRAQGVGRFDSRDARQVLNYVQQLLREENRAFSALGSGVFMEIIDSLNRNVNELKNKLERDSSEGFKIGHPYIFIKPRITDTNIYIEFWSTNGAGGNGIRAGSKINLYNSVFGLSESDIILLTDTVGGSNKPEAAEKELILRQTLLTRNRLVTTEDICAACQTFFQGRVDSRINITVEKGFAQDLIEGAGYVRCLDVWITPLRPGALTDQDWANECERCRHYLASQSAMNLPYRVQLKR